MSVCNDKKPYIFISYSHRDTAKVIPVINKLREHGYNVWYDEGIDPGTEWDENIAKHVKGCTYFIAFVSNNYIGSKNCKDELNYSRDLDKEQLLIYLEDVALPDGMAMRMNRIQAIFWGRYGENVEEAYKKLFTAQGIEKTRLYTEDENGALIPLAMPPVPDIVHVANPAQIVRNNRNKKKMGILIGAAAALLIAIIVLIVVLLNGREKDPEEPTKGEVTTTQAQKDPETTEAVEEKTTQEATEAEVTDEETTEEETTEEETTEEETTEEETTEEETTEEETTEEETTEPATVESEFINWDEVYGVGYFDTAFTNNQTNGGLIINEGTEIIGVLDGGLTYATYGEDGNFKSTVIDKSKAITNVHNFSDTQILYLKEGNVYLANKDGSGIVVLKYLKDKAVYRIWANETGMFYLEENNTGNQMQNKYSLHYYNWEQNKESSYFYYVKDKYSVAFNGDYVYSVFTDENGREYINRVPLDGFGSKPGILKTVLTIAEGYETRYLSADEDYVYYAPARIDRSLLEDVYFIERYNVETGKLQTLKLQGDSHKLISSLNVCGETIYYAVSDLDDNNDCAIYYYDLMEDHETLRYSFEEGTIRGLNATGVSLIFIHMKESEKKAYACELPDGSDKCNYFLSYEE